MKIPIIDQKFIEEWEPKFDILACDYVDYPRILQEVQRELTQNGNITKETAQKIVRWKANRAFNKVRWNLYEKKYAPRFALALSDSIGDHNKIKILVWNRTKLERQLPYRSETFNSIIGDSHGIGTPIASAFLHFMFPSRFAIIDVRVKEVLYLCDIAKSTETNERDYETFRTGMLKIANRLNCSLRTLDKALFAYHEGYLQDQINLKSIALTGVSLILDTNKKSRTMIIDALKKDL